MKIDNLVNIKTGYLPDTCLEHYCYTTLLS